MVEKVALLNHHDERRLSKVGRPLTRKGTNIRQYHFLCRWLVFLVHSCVLFICAERGRTINLHKENLTGVVFPLKILVGFPERGWEGFTCGLTLETRVNFTAGRWRNLRLAPQTETKSHILPTETVETLLFKKFFHCCCVAAGGTTCVSDGFAGVARLFCDLSASNSRGGVGGSSLAPTPLDTPLPSNLHPLTSSAAL